MTATPVDVYIARIQRRVAEFYQIPEDEMTGQSRVARIAFPRQVAMYLARQLTNHSTTEIGLAFGGRDHSTVLHAVNAVRRRAAAEPVVGRAVSILTSELGGEMP